MLQKSQKTLQKASSLQCTNSLKNLSKISNNLKTLLAKGDKISKDWDQRKKVHSGNYGYLNSAINHPEIMEETKLIKQLVRSFNKGRAKIWEYKDLILSYHKRKPDLMNYKQTPFKNLLKQVAL